MKFTDAMRWRYATKKFDPDKTVDEYMVTQLLEATNLSATSYGLQPFKFVVVKNRQLQDQLVASSYGQRQVADASHVIVIAARTDVDADYIKQYIDLVESERSLEPGTMEDYKSIMTGTVTGMSAEAMQQWTANQAYIALGTILAACAMLKIDACPMEGFVSSEYNGILGLGEQNLDAVIVVPIGYRAEDDINQNIKKVRRPLAEMVVRISD
jgi:nitroreductase/dihydropteridine reductase